jgi:hypothetical protein
MIKGYKSTALLISRIRKRYVYLSKKGKRRIDISTSHRVSHNKSIYDPREKSNPNHGYYAYEFAFYSQIHAGGNVFNKPD